MNSLSDGCNIRHVLSRLISPQVDKGALAWFEKGEFRGGCLSSHGLSRQLKSHPTKASVKDTSANSENSLVKKSGE